MLGATHRTSTPAATTSQPRGSSSTDKPPEDRLTAYRLRSTVIGMPPVPPREAKTHGEGRSRRCRHISGFARKLLSTAAGRGVEEGRWGRGQAAVPRPLLGATQGHREGESSSGRCGIYARGAGVNGQNPHSLAYSVIPPVSCAGEFFLSKGCSFQAS